MFAEQKKGCGQNNSWSELWNLRSKFLNYMPKCILSTVIYFSTDVYKCNTEQELDTFNSCHTQNV